MLHQPKYPVLGAFIEKYTCHFRHLPQQTTREDAHDDEGRRTRPQRAGVVRNVSLANDQTSPPYQPRVVNPAVAIAMEWKNLCLAWTDA
jgi:hypothetical protein